LGCPFEVVLDNENAKILIQIIIINKIKRKYFLPPDVGTVSDSVVCQLVTVAVAN